MKCTCGTEFKGNFCPSCGKSAASIYEQQNVGNNMTNNNFYPSVPNAANQSEKAMFTQKKPWYKKPFVWAVIITVVCITMTLSSGKDTNNSDTTKTATTSSSVNKTTTNSNSGESSEQTYKNSCIQVSYDNLARNPSKYEGKDCVITGDIWYIHDAYAEDLVMSIDVGQSWDIELIYATLYLPENSTRLLDGDKIRIWGEFKGIEDHALSTYPTIKIKYYEVLD